MVFEYETTVENANDLCVCAYLSVKNSDPEPIANGNGRSLSTLMQLRPREIVEN
jgi:hypothetical protein